MSTNQKQNTKRNERVSPSFNQSNNKLMLIPLIFIIAFIPLIVRLKIYDAQLENYSWFPPNNLQTDIFLYYKSIFFIITCLIIVTLLIGYYIKHRYFPSKYDSQYVFEDNNKIKYTKVFFPILIYGILAFLSTIMSNYSYFGFRGIFEQFESIFVLLGYCFIVYYAFIFVNTEEDIKFVLKWLFFSILILSLIGLTQITGNDFYTTEVGKKIILPSKYWNQLDNLRFNFEKKRVYLSLYNPNYVGLYASLITPILLVLLLLTKNIKERIMYLLAVVGLLICIVGSSSRNAIVALFTSFIFIILFLRKKIIRNWKISIGFFSVLILAFVLINTYTGNIFIERFRNMFSDSKTPEYSLSSINVNHDNIEITYNNNILYIQFDMDENGIMKFQLSTPAIKNEEPLPSKNVVPVETQLDLSTGNYIISDSRFSDILLQTKNTSNYIGFSIIIDGYNWDFTNQAGDNAYYYVNQFGKLDKIITAESMVFTNHERLGSNRGYIWSRTIPLLKDHFILGSGADTYSLVFPQNDYVGRYHNGYSTSLITKPHNMYLQMGVQTGVLSLVSFLAFYFIYFIACIKLYFKNKFDTFYSQAGVAIFIGSIGYMVSGLFNDSTIAVSPVFWSLIGVGIAINYQVKKAAIE